MNLDLAALRTWLLGTVPGVIVLGAVGSVLGSILFVGARSILRRVKRRWRAFLFAVAYRQFGRHIEIGQHLRRRYADDAKASAYVLFVIGELAGLIFECVIAVAAVAGTVGIAIAYGLERPILLVVAISISTPLILSSLRNGVFLLSLADESVDRVKDEIEASQPKRYRDWVALRSVRSNKPPNPPLRGTRGG